MPRFYIRNMRGRECTVSIRCIVFVMLLQRRLNIIGLIQSYLLRSVVQLSDIVMCRGSCFVRKKVLRTTGSVPRTLLHVFSRIHVVSTESMRRRLCKDS